MEIRNLIPILVLLFFSCEPLVVEVSEPFDPFAATSEEKFETDGKIIYFDYIRNGIYTILASTGTEEVLVKSNVSTVNGISLSYDTQKVAWIDGDFNLHIRHIDSGEEFFLDEIEDIIDIQWSNNDRGVVYLSDNSLNVFNGNYQIPSFAPIAGATILDFAINPDEVIFVSYTGSNPFFNGMTLMMYNTDGSFVEQSVLEPITKLNAGISSENHLSALAEDLGNSNKEFTINYSNTSFNLWEEFYNELVFDRVMKNDEHHVQCISFNSLGINLIYSDEDNNVFKKVTSFTPSSTQKIFFDWKI